MAQVQVMTDEELSYVVGRNGMFYLSAFSIWDAPDGKTVYVEGIGKRGFPVKGGFCIDKKAFIEACYDYLREREKEVGHGRKERI